MSWLILGLVSAVTLGCREIIAKGLFKKFSLNFVAWWFSLFIVIGSMLMPGFTFKIPSELIVWVILKGLILLLILYSLYSALRLGDVSVIIPLTSFLPVFVLIVSAIFLKETLTILQLVGIMLIVLFSFLLPINSWKEIYRPSFFKTKAFGFIVLFFIFVVLGYQFDKIIIGQVSPVSYVFYNFLFVVIFFSYSAKEIKKINNSKEILFLFFIGLVALISELTYAIAVPLIQISILASIRQFNAIFATVVGGWIYKEPRIFYRAIISIFMVISILFLI
ncbi:MAG: EamA family transporter [Candidatus Woesearchaeota archaeon]